MALEDLSRREIAEKFREVFSYAETYQLKNAAVLLSILDAEFSASWIKAVCEDFGVESEDLDQAVVALLLGGFMDYIRSFEDGDLSNLADRIDSFFGDVSGNIYKNR